MRWSKTYVPTLRETPSEAEVASHRLMLRAGLIRKQSAGAYVYLPLGQRVLQKVIRIIREEMDRAGALEVLLPALQRAELWQRSGRYDTMGPEMVRYPDRHGKEMILGPTHEEVITDLVAGEVRSYKELPKTLYQIQTKFRDEARPRFGVIRSCEFLMKDAYSFDAKQSGLDASYDAMYEAYSRIFARCGLEAIPVEADTGVMGGDDSHEFMVLSNIGEDHVARCDCGYAASRDKAEVGAPEPADQAQAQPLETVDTPNISTVEQVCDLLKVGPEQLIKTLLYEADGQPLAVLVRGDHEVNETKLQKALKLDQLELATPEQVQAWTKAPVGFAGPVGLEGVRTVADSYAAQVANAVVGANAADQHHQNANVDRDYTIETVLDVRFPVDGDRCPRCDKRMVLLPAIEVGHIFKLGTKYTQALDALFLDESGKQQPMIMGCYGIGVSRILPAIIETHHDDAGIVWPSAVAPYQVVISPLKMKDEATAKAAEDLYQQCLEAGIEAVLDDRDVSPGVKMKDSELVGIPIRVVVSPKTLEKAEAEVKLRSEESPNFVPLNEVLSILKKDLDKALLSVG